MIHIYCWRIPLQKKKISNITSFDEKKCLLLMHEDKCGITKAAKNERLWSNEMALPLTEMLGRAVDKVGGGGGGEG